MPITKPMRAASTLKRRLADFGAISPSSELNAACNGGFTMLKTWTKSLHQLGRDLNALRPHLRPNRWLVTGAVLASTASALFEGIGIGLLLPLIIMLTGDSAAVWEGKYLRWLPKVIPGLSNEAYGAVFCGLVLAAIGAKNVSTILYQQLQARFSCRISVNLRDALFRRLQSASLHIFEERKAGELASVYATEAIKTQLAVEFVLLLVQRTMVALFYLFAVVLLSWEFVLGLLFLAGVLGWTISFAQVRLGNRGDERATQQRNFLAYVTSVFAGIRVVRANHAEALTHHQFKLVNETLADVERRGAMLSSLVAPVTEMVAMAGAMGLVTLAYAVLIPGQRLTGGELMLIGFVLIRLLPLLNQLYGVLGQLAYYGGSVRECLRWLDSTQFPNRPFGTADFSGVRKAIVLENVSYSYPGGKAALQGINLTIPAGKTVALVGASGSGKTTLANLLLRLREPTAGRILVDGRDFWEFSPASWHGSSGMVEQEAFLFNDTIVNNLKFGCPGATAEDVRRALKIAHLEELVANLPAGLETQVGERGTKLSGGQKQRLAIARAMVRNPQLLLLDEATSALDNLSEREVQAALDDAKLGRTSVVIAHRLSTIRNADLIVVLDQGRIQEVGTWTELAARNEGAFRRLLSAAAHGTDEAPAQTPVTPGKC